MCKFACTRSAIPAQASIAALPGVSAFLLPPWQCADAGLHCRQLRDREMELKAQISAITVGGKETERAEEESGEGGGPMVTEADIATVVSQWTRIPVEKVSCLSGSGRLLPPEAARSPVLHGEAVSGWSVCSPI